ncbi:MAG TPA: ankyrin repeat domain-containing protein, partial [Polyangia bacterium]
MDERLSRAIVAGSLADVRLFVRSGADADARIDNGMTALELAVEHLQLDIVRYLLDVGADANGRDHYGQTPLHWAVDIECEDARYREDMEGVAYAPRATVTPILIEYGADPAIAANNGWTPLHWARVRH